MEDEIFEIVDFTQASPFEKLISDLQNILTQGLNGSIVFKGKRLDLKYLNSERNYRENEVEREGLFPRNFLTIVQNQCCLSCKTCMLHRWTGLISIIVFSTIESTDIKYFASACLVALNNSNTSLPLFIKYLNGNQEMYYGISKKNRIKMLALDAIPTNYCTVASLVKIFESRFKVVDVKACILATFDCPLFNYLAMETSLGVPIGQKYDPVNLNLETIYQMNPVGNFFGMDIDPVLAPQWNLLLYPEFKQDTLSLSSLLQRVFKNMEILNKIDPFDDKRGHDTIIPGAFKSIDTQTTVNKLQDHGITHYLLDIGDLNQAVLGLFSSPTYSKPMICKRKTLDSRPYLTLFQLSSLLRFKGTTIPYESPLWRFSKRLLNACSDKSSILKSETGMIALLKGLWPELNAEILAMWEANLFIPGVEIREYDQESKQFTFKISIDLSHNILHQKLCMINCCMYRKTGLIPTPQVVVKQQDEAKKVLSKNSSPIYSTFEGIAGLALASGESVSKVIEKTGILGKEAHSWASSNIQPSSWSSDKSWISPTSPKQKDKCDLVDSAGWPELEMEFVPKDLQDSFVSLQDIAERQGHKKLIGSLENGTPMWEPITQEPGYMTEDMLKAQAELFESLGASEEGTRIRAKIQSNQLFSDMEAFKAANPGAILQDFVKWHSPRDFEKGELSSRMKADGLWQQLWNDASPLEAKKQKPLFDHEAEAQKAMHYLQTISAHEIINCLLPTFCLILYDNLLNTPAIEIPYIQENFQILADKIISSQFDEQMVSLFNKTEASVCIANSLLQRFPGETSIVDHLCRTCCVSILDEERELIYDTFFKYENIPIAREYLLQGENEKGTQKMYAKLSDSEFRIVEFL